MPHSGSEPLCVAASNPFKVATAVLNPYPDRLVTWLPGRRKIKSAVEGELVACKVDVTQLLLIYACNMENIYIS